VLRDPRNKTRAVALTARQFRDGFGDALTAAESRRLFGAYAMPGRPVFELTAAKRDARSPTAVDIAARC
jgi:non-heme chloroperoxidase